MMGVWTEEVFILKNCSFFLITAPRNEKEIMFQFNEHYNEFSVTLRAGTNHNKPSIVPLMYFLINHWVVVVCERRKCVFLCNADQLK